ncbi:uncharacterized protein BDR25DRAFT_353967 [Lindgomyces ingoldianus]|uniref:Uncharacterized protein n=1 Tax=Lindgomyces ingoldianus TaxID=673940 RepID=A0ACB6QZ01_9PLEO|nr:uncharacterized protein BDR25DRAFT_353967 [Lindgomyces ingoldianus]KAF2472269.1 hypothetical protein BDR25DRAFT_353967 [Lindgomyces ingoldianus]
MCCQPEAHNVRTTLQIGEGKKYFLAHLFTLIWYNILVNLGYRMYLRCHGFITSPQSTLKPFLSWLANDIHKHFPPLKLVSFVDCLSASLCNRYLHYLLPPYVFSFNVCTRNLYHNPATCCFCSFIAFRCWYTLNPIPKTNPITLQVAEIITPAKPPLVKLELEGEFEPPVPATELLGAAGFAFVIVKIDGETVDDGEAAVDGKARVGGDSAEKRNRGSKFHREVVITLWLKILSNTITSVGSDIGLPQAWKRLGLSVTRGQPTSYHQVNIRANSWLQTIIGVRELEWSQSTRTIWPWTRPIMLGAYTRRIIARDPCPRLRKNSKGRTLGHLKKTKAWKDSPGGKWWEGVAQGLWRWSNSEYKGHKGQVIASSLVDKRFAEARYRTKMRLPHDIIAQIRWLVTPNHSVGVANGRSGKREMKILSSQDSCYPWDLLHTLTFPSRTIPSHLLHLDLNTNTNFDCNGTTHNVTDNPFKQNQGIPLERQAILWLPEYPQDLCNVQRGEEGFFRESRTMISVYQRPWRIMTATAARDSTEGCFKPQKPDGLISQLYSPADLEHDVMLFGLEDESKVLQELSVLLTNDSFCRWEYHNIFLSEDELDTSTAADLKGFSD